MRNVNRSFQRKTMARSNCRRSSRSISFSHPLALESVVGKQYTVQECPEFLRAAMRKFFQSVGVAKKFCASKAAELINKAIEDGISPVLTLLSMGVRAVKCMVGAADQLQFDCELLTTQGSFVIAGNPASFVTS